MPRQTRPLAAVLLALAVAASPAAAVKRRAFVTSVTGTGNLSTWPGAGGAAGVTAGDNICRARAAAAGLPNANTYLAWLSTTANDAYCHVQGLGGTRMNACNIASQPGGGPWYLYNGLTPFTGSLADLTNSPWKIFRPVAYDEFGNVMTSLGTSEVWTGTTDEGIADGQDCSGWTSASSGAHALLGTALGTAETWSKYVWSTCDGTARLLCVEPGASEDPSVGWSPGALVFISSASGTGDLSSWPEAYPYAGLIAGDAICQRLAAAAHLPAPESFVAWLSVVGFDAIDSLTLPATVSYRRLDGFAIGNRNSLATGVPTNTIHVTEQGHYLSYRGETFTGTGADGTSTAVNCSNWSSSDAGVEGTTGDGTYARVAQWTDSGPQLCSYYKSLFCISNRVTIFWDGFDYTGDTSRWSSTAP